MSGWPVILVITEYNKAVDEFVVKSKEESKILDSVSKYRMFTVFQLSLIFDDRSKSNCNQYYPEEIF